MEPSATTTRPMIVAQLKFERWRRWRQTVSLKVWSCNYRTL